MKLWLTLVALGLVCTWGLVADVATPEADAQVAAAPCLLALNRCCLPAYAAPPLRTASCPVGPPCTLSTATSCSGQALARAIAGVCNPENGSTCSICQNDFVQLALPVYQCQVVQCDHPCYTDCEWVPGGLIACCASVQRCGSTKCSTF